MLSCISIDGIVLWQWLKNVRHKYSIEKRVFKDNFIINCFPFLHYYFYIIFPEKIGSNYSIQVTRFSFKHINFIIYLGLIGFFSNFYIDFVDIVCNKYTYHSEKHFQGQTLSKIFKGLIFSVYHNFVFSVFKLIWTISLQLQYVYTANVMQEMRPSGALQHGVQL